MLHAEKELEVWYYQGGSVKKTVRSTMNSVIKVKQCATYCTDTGENELKWMNIPAATQRLLPNAWSQAMQLLYNNTGYYKLPLSAS